ncbi:uncharacterized protein B0H64DRAFT_54597 [Chaetomium fimeti]|uniref:Uncharacterized protein n=1 Tax=Chaetomium fimeti TaxID=1854472 RepID=A0AAE0H668_9PEZI|nr:hypothetical protein B0H64DRAFT_54597 [Chaetomium fimeti]
MRVGVTNTHQVCCAVVNLSVVASMLSANSPLTTAIPKHPGGLSVLGNGILHRGWVSPTMKGDYKYTLLDSVVRFFFGVSAGYPVRPNNFNHQININSS